MGHDQRPEHPQHLNQSELTGRADVVQARDVHGGVHFHTSAPAGPLPPRQLPGDVRNFVNRHDELTFLDGLLREDPSQPSAVTLIVVTGTAGVGKTSLALRWAHSVRPRFPDGQLYANLKGYDPGPPTTPEQGLDRFLRALDVPAAAIPADVEERAAVYRSQLADRRMLIILDNAATVGQVRPLLPGTASSLVIVTSRGRLSGLVARDGGQRITLDILPEPDAVALLRDVTVGYRDGDEPAELRELARLCARLPLALRIAAERAASRPHMPLTELIQDLRDESALWDALTAESDEEGDAVRTVFAWSYRALPDGAAHLFRLLGLHPGAEFSTGAAAALLGTGHRVRHLLDVLVGAHLLDHRAPERYQLHDLLRAYATDQVRHHESEPQRHAALRRLLDWYLHTADAALATAWPFNRTIALDTPVDVTPVRFATPAEATAWYEVERDNLVAATRAAGQAGLHRTAWQLAAVLRSYFMHLNAFEDWMATGLVGLAAARSAQDPYGESEVLESLGKACFQALRLDEAAAYYQRALDLRRQLGNRFGEAVSTNALGLLGLRRRRLDESLRHFRHSLAIFEELDNRRWVALLLSNLGETLYELGDLADASDHLHRALVVQREIGDRAQEGNSLFFLAMTQRELGYPSRALASIDAALAIASEADNPVWQAHWLVELARTRRALGQPTEALAPLHRAAVLQRTLGDRNREAMALDATGEIYRDLGRPGEAVTFHHQAAKTHRDLGDGWHLAIALHHLATALTDLNRTPEAHRHWTEASSMLDTYPDRRAAALRHRFDEASPGSP